MPEAVAVHSILQDSVTAHMRADFALIRQDQTVAEALASLRASQPTGRVIYFYVADATGKLVGVLPARRLLLADAGTPVAGVMVKRVLAIPQTATVLDACEFFTLYKLLAFPIVDADRRMIGLIDVDLYTDERHELDPEDDHDDLFQLIGVHLQPADRGKVWAGFRSRFPWLLCNLAGGLLAAFLSDIYQDVATLAVVTPFIPMVLALSESVAIQSVSLTVGVMHKGRPTWRSFRKGLGRELAVGLMLGAGCGLLVATIALIWMGKPLVGLGLFVGITGGVAGAACVGMALPVLLRLLKRDPSVASGPIALAAADTIALLLYFNLARLLLT